MKGHRMGIELDKNKGEIDLARTNAKCKWHGTCHRRQNRASVIGIISAHVATAAVWRRRWRGIWTGANSMVSPMLGIGFSAACMAFRLEAAILVRREVRREEGVKGECLQWA